jgi:hypothetical protein
MIIHLLQVWSRGRRSRSRIALRLRLRQNDAAPCGSGSATLVGSFDLDFYSTEYDTFFGSYTLNTQIDGSESDLMYFNCHFKFLR